MTQALDAMPDRMMAVARVMAGRSKAMGEFQRMLAHVAEALADRRTRMIGLKRGLPFQGAQQLLTDRVIAGMAECAQAGGVERLGAPVKTAQQ